MLQTNRNVPTHDGSLFTWLGTQGTVEVSSLPRYWACDVFPDAADVGFFIVSPRTNRKLLFTLTDVSTPWEDETILTFTAFDDPAITVRVFND